MYINSQNPILTNYLDFVSTSQESFHELLTLIRQQDNTFQNILTRPPPQPSPLRHQSIYVPNRYSHININNRRDHSHSSGPYSVPSRSFIPNNLIFRNSQERILPRSANINNNENNIPTMIQILRSTETKPYSTISQPVNTSCPICQEEFSENQEVIQIKNCQHIFKPEALLRWFSRNATCPFCRYDIRNFNIDLSNNDNEETNEMEIENETTNNTETISNVTTSDENMVQTISRLISENIRENLDNDNEEFHYTILSQRIQSPESRD